MRNMLLALAALGVVSFATTVIADDVAAPSVLEAAEVIAPVAQPQPIAHDAVVAAEPAAVQHQHVHHYRKAPKKKMGPLARLWELEKRKNAWLKKTFLGR